VKATPLCKKCHHAPCPSCESWCDVVVWRVYCRKCDRVACEVGRLLDGDPITCQHCGDQWDYDNDQDGEPDLCCEGECEYEQPPDEVAAWCGSYRKEQVNEPS